MTPPVRQSPTVPKDQPGAADEPITGSHFIPATQKDLKKVAKKVADAERWWKVLIGLIGGGGSIAFAGLAFAIYFRVLNDARAQTDAGMAPDRQRITLLEVNQQTIMGEVTELRKDVRELYKSQRDDRKSDRLEAPLPPPPALLRPDGGSP